MMFKMCRCKDESSSYLWSYDNDCWRRMSELPDKYLGVGGWGEAKYQSFVAS